MADTVNESGIAAETGAASGERRAEVRTQVLETAAGIVAVELDQGDSGIILDLTADGMMVQCLAPLVAGDTRAVSFVLPGSASPLKLSAVVVWSDPEGRAGLRFRFANDGSRKELKAWVAESCLSIFNASTTLFAPSLDLPPQPPAPPRSAPVNAASSAPVPKESSPSPTLSDPLQRLSLADAFPNLNDAPDEHQRAVNATAWSIVEEISRLTPANGAVVAVAQGDTITCRASWGSAPGVGARLQPEIGLSGECFRSGRAILCNDAEADSRVPSSVSKRLNLQSILVVPVPGANGPLGLLEALAGEKNTFTDSHVRILARLAASLAEVLQPGTAPKPAVKPQASAPSVQAPAAAPAPKPEVSSTQPLVSAPAPSRPIPAQPRNGNSATTLGSKAAPAVSQPKANEPKPAAKTPPAVARPAKPVAAPTSFPSGGRGTAAAAKLSPLKKPASPAATLDLTARQQDEVLPLAGSVQDAFSRGVPTVANTASPRVSRPAAPSYLSVEAGSDDSANRTMLYAGVAAVVLLALVAALWTLSHRSAPSASAAQAAVEAQPAASGTLRDLEASGSTSPQNAPVAAPADLSASRETPPPPSQPPAATDAMATSRPASPQPRSSEPRIQEGGSAAREEEDVVLYASREDIRRPAAVANPGRAVDSTASVPPPPTVPAAGNGSAPALLSGQITAPRLAAPPPPTAPQLIHRVEPAVPQNARTLRGTVVLSAVIGTDGKPTDIKAVSGQPLLVGAAISAFRNWRYEPARRAGTPIEVPLQVRFVFNAQ